MSAENPYREVARKFREQFAHIPAVDVVACFAKLAVEVAQTCLGHHAVAWPTDAEIAAEMKKKLEGGWRP